MLLYQFGTRIEPSWVRLTMSGGLILSAGALAIGAFHQWKSYQCAMRLDHPLPSSTLIVSMVVVVLTLSLSAGGVLLWL